MKALPRMGETTRELNEKRREWPTERKDRKPRISQRPWGGGSNVGGASEIRVEETAEAEGEGKQEQEEEARSERASNNFMFCGTRHGPGREIKQCRRERRGVGVHGQAERWKVCRLGDLKVHHLGHPGCGEAARRCGEGGVGGGGSAQEG